MIRRPPRSTQSRSSAASDVYKRQSLFYPDPDTRTPHSHYVSNKPRFVPLLWWRGAVTPSTNKPTSKYHFLPWYVHCGQRHTHTQRTKIVCCPPLHVPFCLVRSMQRSQRLSVCFGLLCAPPCGGCLPCDRGAICRSFHTYKYVRDTASFFLWLCSYGLSLIHI